MTSETNKFRNIIYWKQQQHRVFVEDMSAHSCEMGAENIDNNDSMTCQRKWTLYTELLFKLILLVT